MCRVLCSKIPEPFYGLIAMFDLPNANKIVDFYIIGMKCVKMISVDKAVHSEPSLSCTNAVPCGQCIYKSERNRASTRMMEPLF
jgi:hypothetical protein